ncbi:MAG TPA: hypothetical protein DCF49_05115 [Lachnospiraceae bacterium]|nr:hypothetical protein [Lachnospiraceae bacterium]
MQFVVWPGRVRWAGEKVSYFAEFYYDLSAVRERDRPKLGVRSDDRTPQTDRAFGLQELQSSPSLFLQKDHVKLAAHSKPSPRSHLKPCPATESAAGKGTCFCCGRMDLLAHP